MTRTLQGRFFENLDQRLAEHGCEAIVQYVAANTGRVDVLAAGTLGEPLLSFTFRFRANHNVLESDTPVWPEGRLNPKMKIARSAGEIGRAVDQIMYVIAGAAPAVAPAGQQPEGWQRGWQGKVSRLLLMAEEPGISQGPRDRLIASAADISAQYGEPVRRAPTGDGRDLSGLDPGPARSRARRPRGRP